VTAETWQDVAVAALNVGQVVLLAWIASRGRRRRAADEDQGSAGRNLDHELDTPRS
jgi:hypothetical protein